MTPLWKLNKHDRVIRIYNTGINTRQQIIVFEGGVDQQLRGWGGGGPSQEQEGPGPRHAGKATINNNKCYS